MSKFVPECTKRAVLKKELGFTIMEIMIVIIIISATVTGVALSIGANSSAKLHSSSLMIVSAVKYAYSRSVSSGSTVRMVLDFKENTIQLQETFGRVVLNREDETGIGLNRKKYDDEYKADGTVVEHSFKDKMKKIGPTVTGQSVSSGTGNPMPAGGAGMGDAMTGGMYISDPFLKSIQNGMSGGGVPHYKGPRFEVIEGSRGKKRKLKSKIGFLKVFSPHTPLAIEEGFAFIYFFPGGMTEHTYIQLTTVNDDDPKINTIEIHPLNGSAKVYHKEVEPEVEDLSDMQEGDQ